MKIDLKSGEFPPSETYKIGRSRWEPQTALPDMRKIIHQCKVLRLPESDRSALTSWYIFFRQHNTVTLEELLQELKLGEQKKDYYDFNKYCLALYRRVHEEQLTWDLNYVERNLLKRIMKQAEKIEKYGDDLHADPKNDYWQKNACVAAPGLTELPQEYAMALANCLLDVEKLMAEYKGSQKPEDPLQADVRRATINSRIHTATEDVRANLER